MSSVYSNSPRGLVINSVNALWPQVVAKVIAKAIAIDIDLATDETAIGEINVGSNGSSIAWAVGFESETVKSVFVGFRSGIDGEVHSHSSVPVNSDEANANYLIEVDAALKAHYSDANIGVSPTMQTITALIDFITAAKSIIDEDVADGVTLANSQVIKGD